LRYFLRLKNENLDARLGGLTERVKQHLINRKSAVQDDDIAGLKCTLLETVFTIAKERGWLMSIPECKNDTYTFNISSAHFAPKRTAIRLAEKNKA
jgi:hypothetical protein